MDLNFCGTFLFLENTGHAFIGDIISSEGIPCSNTSAEPNSSSIASSISLLITPEIPLSFLLLSDVAVLNSTVSLRDAIIKENPVKSGFLQIGGGGGSQRPPDPDLLHVI